MALVDNVKGLDQFDDEECQKPYVCTLVNEVLTCHRSPGLFRLYQRHCGFVQKVFDIYQGPLLPEFGARRSEALLLSAQGI